MSALLALLLAHEATVSSSRLELGEREIRATFTFSLEDLAGLARLDLDRNGIVEPEEWRRVLPAIVDYVGRKFRIENCVSEGDPDALPPALSVAEGRAPVTLVLRYRSPKPLGQFSVRCTLFDEHGGNPRHVSELSGGRTIVFDRDRSEVRGLSGSRSGHLGFSLASVAIVAALSLGIFLRRRPPPPGFITATSEGGSGEITRLGNDADPDRLPCLRAGAEEGRGGERLPRCRPQAGR
ncbi:MAG TPA: hypothetical protein VNM14_18155 [Planctomycetota bacterium]|jgi:hypothetical protein|nr:hypothetical protein [Planctomycetota bacterium]